MTDPDEYIDPLDPRFVDAVLARARRKAVTDDQPAAAPASPPPPAVPPAPVAQTAAAPAGATPGPPPQAAAAPVPPAPAPPAPVHDHADEHAPLERGPVTTVFDTRHEVGPADTATDLDDDGDGEDDDDATRRRTRSIVEWIAVAVGAVVVAFLIRAFLLQAFYIPSESMEPTLRENDRILVNKLSYKLHDVNRGDLVVFEKPANEPAGNINDLIKRAIALEGETIELQPDGTITIDGRLLEEPYLRDGQPPGQLAMSRDNFVEGACTNPPAETTRCTVGDGFVWVMGDNRDHSHDSRAFGPIDEDLIVGRAFVKVWPLSEIGFL